jgi:flagella basal body P-ring formation protein FlgA
MTVALILMLLLPAGDCVVPRAALEKAVESYLRGRMTSGRCETVIEFRSVPDDLKVSRNPYAIRVTETNHPRVAGNLSVPVEIGVAGKTEVRCIVSVRVRTFDSVLVAARQLGRHETLDDAAVRKERIETTDVKDAIAPQMTELAGKRTKRIIKTGTILTDDMLQQVPEVRQGSMVMLVVKGRNFSFSTDAMVKQDGMRGEQVLVQRVGGSARVRATVVDANTVEMRIQ